MNKRLILAAALMHALLTISTAAENQWRYLFDGKNTNGWQMLGPGELKLEKGHLVTYGGMGMLWFTKEKFGDCQIKVVFMLTAPTNNSGVFVRIPEPPKEPFGAVNKGYEIQIDNTGDEHHRTGCLYSLTKAQNLVDAKVNEWNTMLVTLDGPRTIVEINGKVVTDYTEGDPVPDKKIWYEPERGRRPNQGYLGLQNHGGEDHVHFRSVAVRPLAKK